METKNKREVFAIPNDGDQLDHMLRSLYSEVTDLTLSEIREFHKNGQDLKNWKGYESHELSRTEISNYLYFNEISVDSTFADYLKDLGFELERTGKRGNGNYKLADEE